jgi:hypothetical protein
MDEREFSQADQLYHSVAAARYTMQLLISHLHRIRCGPGYGGGWGLIAFCRRAADTKWRLVPTQARKGKSCGVHLLLSRRFLQGA